MVLSSDIADDFDSKKSLDSFFSQKELLHVA